ncbi:tumor necrosis factor receptor superfamily member 10B-like isoform 2-T2 [Anomaloglossus baeobatrachus]|uniref:tumor necrosis factor receptor superfamily member 10B-like isoform X2 n=1 Tax=Anomaloglossus baeobatrachus TaxID=238106 RepID=UPI003F50C4C1
MLNSLDYSPMAPQRGHNKSKFLVMMLAIFFLGLAHGYRIPKSIDHDEIYYMNGNVRCLRCPPGYYVRSHCTSEDTLGTCAPCHPGYTYSEHLTGLTECLHCAVCRADQIEESPCTITKNTVCQCKEGTYCPPDDSCEICLKCTTSCPPNEVKQAPCNSTTDTQCAPPEAGINLVAALLLPVLGIIFLLLAAVCVWFFCFRKSSDRSKWIPKASSEDTETPFLSKRPTLHLKENITPNEKNEAINGAFNMFVDLVPAKKFERFVRELGLSDNDIENSKADNTGVENQRYTMLSQLHQNKNFDVNIWLSKLDSMKLGKVAQDITAKLIENGWLKRST